jgi:hypothetical protein
VNFNFEQNHQSKAMQIQLVERQSGLYFIQGSYENGIKFVSKFVID